MIIDLFSGAGGWDTGAAACGIHDIIGIEMNEVAGRTAAAAGHFSLRADVATTDPLDFSGARGLIASPPCQGFSTAGSGRGVGDLPEIIKAVGEIGMGLDPREHLREVCDDERSALVVEPIRWAVALRPEWIAFEQVPSVLPVWEACARVLVNHGYSTWVGKIHTEQFGIPQTRTRTVLMASRTRLVTPPVPTHSKYYPGNPTKLDPGVPSWVSMADVLPGWTISNRPSPTVCGNHGSYAKGGKQAIVIARDLLVMQAGPPWLRSNYGTGGDTDKRGMRSVNQPSPTVTSKFDRNKWIDDESGELSRENAVTVTIPEAAAIQTFPPDYPWHGNKGQIYLQIGNAVPPLMSTVILSALTGCSDKGQQ
jgi:DNA (cytosine-5)-methyltransferase 1